MRTSIERTILNDQQISRFEGDVSLGSGLPNACYTSGAWLDAENTSLFPRTWMLAGFCHDISEKGDACPVSVAGVPLVILRDNNGDIGVFHNVCRHRGAVLVPKACKGQRVLTCPYHAWAYGLDGSLRARPHFHGGDRHDTNPGPDAPGLVSVRHAVWNDFIFVDLSGTAVDFESHWEPFARRTKAYDFTALRYSHSLRFDIKANWKLVYENFIDPYHVPRVHPKLEAFTAITERPATSFEDAWLFATVQIPELEEGRGMGLPHYPGLDAWTSHTEWYFHLFPTTCIQIWPDQLAVFQLDAKAPGFTVEHIHLYFIGDAGADPRFAGDRQAVYDMWDELNTEDFVIVESMQAARNSSAFDGGVLSPFWDPATQYFAKLVSDGMS